MHVEGPTVIKLHLHSHAHLVSSFGVFSQYYQEVALQPFLHLAFIIVVDATDRAVSWKTN